MTPWGVLVRVQGHHRCNRQPQAECSCAFACWMRRSSFARSRASVVVTVILELQYGCVAVACWGTMTLRRITASCVHQQVGASGLGRALAVTYFTSQNHVQGVTSTLWSVSPPQRFELVTLSMQPTAVTRSDAAQELPQGRNERISGTRHSCQSSTCAQRTAAVPWRNS